MKKLPKLRITTALVFSIVLLSTIACIFQFIQIFRHSTITPFVIQTNGNTNTFKYSENELNGSEIFELENEIYRTNLTEVPLNSLKIKCEHQKTECPTFGLLSKHLSAFDIHVCQNSQFKDSFLYNAHATNARHSKKKRGFDQGNVFWLKNVFLSERAFVFNESHIFQLGGCVSNFEFFFKNRTRYQKFKFLISPVIWRANNYYHVVAEALPNFVILENLLNAYANIPIAMASGHYKGMYKEMLEMAGFGAYENRFAFFHNLVFAENLVVPSYQYCARPSWSVVRNIQQKLTRVDSQVDDSNKTELADENLHDSTSEGWNIVLGVRAPNSPRSLLNSDQLLEALALRYGSQHVKVFDGAASRQETRQLFSRTLLFISPHGAGLTNLIYMPERRAIIEIRPMGHDIKCFDHMSRLLGHKYENIYVQGNKSSILYVDVDRVMSIVEELLPTIGLPSTD